MTERYPSAIELKEIEKWGTDYKGLLELVRSIWAYRDYGWKERRGIYYVSTVGWSGNEELIEAMKNNKNYFWFMCWYQSTRGGHYIFKIPKISKQVKKK